jgi:TolB protein
MVDLTQRGTVAGTLGVPLALLALTSALLAAAPPAAQSHARAASASPGTLLFTANGGLFTIRSDGTQRRRVIKGPIIQASWSPDGRRIAYTRSEGDTHPEIWVADADGTNARRLAPSAPVGIDSAPDWSPDGRRLVFQGEWMRPDEELALDMFIVEVANARLTRLTWTPLDWEFNPAWSPDGSQIAYSRGNARDDDGIYLLDLGSRRTRAITRVSYSDRRAGTEHDEPAWSADGRRIAFQLRAYANGDLRPAIQSMNANGTNRRRIVSTESGLLGTPSWSPDGNRIAYVASIGKPGVNGIRSWALFIIKRDGSQRRQLVVGASYPDWHPSR